MPENRGTLHSLSGKRQILIVDDERINREILGEYLQDSYTLLFAENGAQALDLIRENADTLSLVLLDILMPVLSGLEVLSKMRSEESLMRMPVIVITADQAAEIESLTLGANDFIPKPYPAPDVVRARVKHTIELSEDREIISSTERDALTGLYNKDYFYRYAEQFDQFHRDLSTDAILLDVNHFHLINERYGKDFGDRLLRQIASACRQAVKEDGGIVCRREADTFLIYRPHRNDCAELIARISEALGTGQSRENRIRLRMGVYADTDRTIDIERRFDRAKSAADTIRGSFTRNIAFYDERMHKRELFTAQLIEDFHSALRDRQFKVYFQPKFDVRSEDALLSSAEALVRWVHPALGLISPGDFIPLFEENGLIRELDSYVWDETARKIRDWYDRFGEMLCVSVNISRVDMYDPDLIQTLQGILKKYDLPYSALQLEVTESAYTQDTNQIVDVVQRLQKVGFCIEMDDFGTGYSSLNMLSTLPLDALKLDMQFIRDAFREGGSTRMLQVIIDFADYLKVPVIAEGVETRDQLDTLRPMGCAIVQGYYFSKPLPAAEFESFLEKEYGHAPSSEKAKPENTHPEEAAAAPAAPLSGGEADDTGFKEEDTPSPSSDAVKKAALARAYSLKEEARSGFPLRRASFLFSVIAFLTAIALFTSNISVLRGYERLERSSDRYIESQLAAASMEQGSDYLTEQARSFVATGDMAYLKAFFEEVEVTRTRDKAVETMEALLPSGDRNALGSLQNALSLSNDLMDTEKRAMLLKLAAGGYLEEDIPASLLPVSLSTEDEALSAEEKNAKALDLVFNDSYMQRKGEIRKNVRQCTEDLLLSTRRSFEEASESMELLIRLQAVMTFLLLLVTVALVVFVSRQIRRPLTRMVDKMRAQDPIEPSGAQELRFVTATYNAVLADSLSARESLSHAASHDSLTGLLNRGAYDMMMKEVDASHIALILIDVDYFKAVNDRFGHAVGDRILKRVAELLKKSFRSVDMICRIGGDEFAVIMTRVDSSLQQLVRDKIMKANDLLQHPSDDLPPVSLSVGIAFSDRKNPQGDIFRDADTALYRVKEAGRNGCEVY